MSTSTTGTKGITVARVNFKEDMVVEQISKAIMQTMKSKGKDYSKIVFFNIGTDRCTGDALAPMLGTLLTEQSDLHESITINGTMERPNHALNLERHYAELDHDNTFIIGVDACLGEPSEIGSIIVRNSGIRAGAGVGKNLGIQGDMSILGITGEKGGFDAIKSIRLDLIYKMAKVMQSIVVDFSEQVAMESNNGRVIEFKREVM